jgi:integrase
MRGSMRQRSEGSWELRVFVGRDPLTGRRQYVTKTVRGGKREAQKALAALVAGPAPTGPAAAMTTGQMLERWFEQAEPNLSPSTADHTRIVLDAHLLPHVGETPLRKLTTAKIDALYRLLSERGGRGGKPLAPATVRRTHNVLHRALGQAVRWGWLTVNPAAASSPPRLPSRDIKPPSPEQVRLLFVRAAEENPAFAVFLQLAAATGARRGELVALRWMDVDLAKGVVTIARGAVKGKDGLVFKDTKTHGIRRIALDQSTVALLAAHRQSSESVARACETALPEDAYVFSDDPDGRSSWRPWLMTQAFARLAERAGMPEVRLHDLRHFVATRLLSNGVDVRTVAGRLGHKNPNVTLSVYAHFLPEADREAADLLGRLLSPVVDPE